MSSMKEERPLNRSRTSARARYANSKPFINSPSGSQSVNPSKPHLTKPPPVNGDEIICQQRVTSLTLKSAHVPGNHLADRAVTAVHHGYNGNKLKFVGCGYWESATQECFSSESQWVYDVSTWHRKCDYGPTIKGMRR
ncbi:hypothetical protein E1301_Tti019306 [Triplophysa tibetana]|uniref:Uncharacterized protein n=1 Tax=Triplophysa tibetana TaxID=1572043 RepID=A0A5A9PIP9_9TELE|nr:hypothetical protein E1301_Tti019306 [Triplophysa tibetana]